MIGVGLGLAAGGAAVSLGGVALGLANAIGGTVALQSVALGFLAMNIPFAVILPLFGIEVELVEYETAPPLTTPIIP